MGTKPTKRTSAAKRKVRETTKRPSTPLEQAKAYLAVYNGRGFSGQKANLQTLVGFTSDDTTHNVRCVLDAFSYHSFQDHTVTTDMEYGVHLILAMCVEALDHAKTQGQFEHKAALARGAIDALEGAK